MFGDDIKVDVPKVRKVLEWATEQHYLDVQGEESEWRQDSWFCGTTCCIAGKVALNAGWSEVRSGDETANGFNVVNTQGELSNAEDVAIVELGLPRQVFVTPELFKATNDVCDIWRFAEKLTKGELRPPLDIEKLAYDRVEVSNGYVIRSR